ncbi:prephenate dehydratase [Oxynema aestuarii]|jgi:prephenate dehydratase|uniref:Prephenate dehydratase n=1 Tax=Oxynema aestuarii AP17 TaxID=2064643 RepID=A0A6H1U128_9CYAN|nr:prephenate dehydratase [Oxynema aestuarii]QIZ72578.1 prephenate dehydratase [Oxynema aestuarii AP17]RMH74834.1 MAG: prephenate dehydratase [Cyanobacteria bacterium J007]
MNVSLAYLGPPGTYSEAAALSYVKQARTRTGMEYLLCPYPSIAQTLQAVAGGEVQIAVVPVENSIEGSVTVTLDTVWQLDKLRIQEALVLPISHALISPMESLSQIKTIYSHPQALAQCQGWLEQFLPQVQLIPTNSTTEAVRQLEEDPEAGAIASCRAAELYEMPIAAYPINDSPDNCTRFWVVSLQPSPGGSHTSLAFTVPANVPGSLVQPLQVFAQRNINMSRIESRPTKRSLGDYLFFIDLEADTRTAIVQSALEELKGYTNILKIFGSYSIVQG